MTEKVCSAQIENNFIINHASHPILSQSKIRKARCQRFFDAHIYPAWNETTRDACVWLGNIIASYCIMSKHLQVSRAKQTGGHNKFNYESVWISWFVHSRWSVFWSRWSITMQHSIMLHGGVPEPIFSTWIQIFFLVSCILCENASTPHMLLKWKWSVTCRNKKRARGKWETIPRPEAWPAVLIYFFLAFPEINTTPQRFSQYVKKRIPVGKFPHLLCASLTWQFMHAGRC